MANITLKGTPVTTSGEIPAVGTDAPDFKLVAQDLGTVTLENYQGKRKILNIFPSIDTPVCALSVKAFTKNAADKDNTVVLHIAADLPFASKRFCGAEGVENAQTLSTFRGEFSKDYGLEIVDGPLEGLCSRVVLVLDENNKVIYGEQVDAIEKEPNMKKLWNH